MKKTFETVAKFTYVSEAFVVKGRLESEGIPAFVIDGGVMDSDPLINNIIGGVKLNVYVEDKEKAIAVMEEISKFSLDDTGEAISCPNCKGNEVEFFSNTMDSPFLISSLLRSLFPKWTAYKKYDYRCKICKHEFLLS